MAPKPVIRGGEVCCRRAIERWTAEVRLDEGAGADARQHTIVLNGTFPTETSAKRAGEQILAEWRDGRASLNDLLLKQLAATYRALREKNKPMHPPTVPATRSAWDGAIDAWEERGWLGPADAARYRDHVTHAFGADAAKVRRHRLMAEPEPEPSG